MSYHVSAIEAYVRSKYEDEGPIYKAETSPDLATMLEFLVDEGRMAWCEKDGLPLTDGEGFPGFFHAVFIAKVQVLTEEQRGEIINLAHRAAGTILDDHEKAHTTMVAYAQSLKLAPEHEKLVIGAADAYIRVITDATNQEVRFLDRSLQYITTNKRI